MTDFTAADLDRLRKLVGMLGSEHDGEVLAAARKATGLLKSHKLTWADVIGQPRPVQPSRPFQQGSQPDVDARARDAMREFAERMAGFGEAFRQASRAASASWSGIDLARAEAQRVAQARIALDMILERKNLDRVKREHFESIRSYHREHGYINTAHGAQIMREYYKNGWDHPLDPDPNAKANIQTDENGKRYVMKDGNKVYLGSLEDD